MPRTRSSSSSNAVTGSRRSLPSVDQVLGSLDSGGLPRALTLHVVRRELNRLRRSTRVPSTEKILAGLEVQLTELRRSRIQPVINGTGIVIHTNLGRAPLPASAVEALGALSGGYSNLEFDLGSGRRGSRGDYLEQTLALLCRAGAATVVNNCAAALVMILRQFTAGERKEVVLSRGELVQIGGGFRVPEILEASGACLREVGTTNRTTLADYARAVGRQTALLLKVHRSNFFMEGFVAAPSTAELAQLARRKRLPLVEDLGSGAVFDTSQVAGLEQEPSPADVLGNGVGLVCFSGDKLLGGAQAGVIAGRAKWVAALKRDPLFRAFRCDKLVLSSLQATVDRYLSQTTGDWKQGRACGVPVVDLLRTPLAELRERAKQLLARLSELPLGVRKVAGWGQVGGGTLPRARLESIQLEIESAELGATGLADRLRRGIPPVIGVVKANRFRIDLRTVFPGQDEALVQALRKALERS